MDRTFVGLKDIARDNFWQDAGMTKESQSMQLFARALRHPSDSSKTLGWPIPLAAMFKPPFLQDDAPPGEERRVRSGRREMARGGRRRSDRPEDAGITSCPRCGDPHPKLEEIRLHDYHWTCDGCRTTFVTMRASRFVL